MKTTLMRFLAAIPLVAAGSMLYTESANAFSIKLFDPDNTSTSIEVADGDNLDKDKDSGQITLLDQTIGGITADFTFSATKPALGSAFNPKIDFQTSTGGSAGKIGFQVSEIGFSGDLSKPFKTTVANGSSNFAPSSTLDLSSFIDSGNTLFGKGDQLSQFTGLNGNFSEADIASASFSGTPYSLTLEGVFESSGASSNPSFSAGIKQVPEPFTIMGSLVALGFGAYTKRKFKPESQAN